MRTVVRNLLKLLAFGFIGVIGIGNAYAGETAKPVFDKRSWELGWRQDNDESSIEEYVLSGETVDNWSELVTMQILRGMQKATNLDVFEGAMKVKLATICPSIKWDSISQSEASRIWKWTIKDCPGQPDQSELAMVTKTKEAIHLWHYAIKKSPLPKKAETEWMKNLKSIKIENSK